MNLCKLIFPLILAKSIDKSTLEELLRMVYCAERQNISMKVITDFQTKAAGTCFRKNAKRLDLKTTERKETERDINS